MNHIAFNVPEERFLDYRAKLKAKVVRVSPILDHDDSQGFVKVCVTVRDRQGRA